MARSRETWSKKEVRNTKEKKRKDKEKKKLERKSQDSAGFEDMIAYVDEFGNISNTPPDPELKRKDISLDEIVIGIPKREEVAYDPIRKGIVTFFNDSKGYGFIKDSENQTDVFFHVNDLQEPVVENNKVIFEVERGHKGLVAVRIKKDK